MTTDHGFFSILRNLSNHAPLDLDGNVFDMGVPARELPFNLSAFPPSIALWERSDDGPSRIGIRVLSQIENADFLAARLASIAIERQIYPVFLNHGGKSDMQRFGFRVEQISGIDVEARFQFEEQVSRFWKLALIVDASEIDKLQ